MESQLTREVKFQWNGGISCKIKYIIRKCKNENSDPCQAIVEFPNTPSKSTGMSPVQRFFGKQLRSELSTMKKFLSPFNAGEAKTKIRKAKQQKKLYDKNANDLTELKKGDQATVQPYSKTSIGKRQLSQKSLNTGDTWPNLKMEKD